jgi:microcystin-dependent protein
MDQFIGSVCAFGFNYAPVDWMFCQGQSMPINNYQALFALIGTTYGGDGVTTFNLPNLQGAAAIGDGQGPGLSNYVWGQKGGSNTVTLTATNLPGHTHPISFTFNGSNNTATTGTPAGGFPADEKNGTPYATPPATANTFMGALAAANQPVLSPSGGNQPLSIQRPSLAMNYCIAVNGIFPSRN